MLVVADGSEGADRALDAGARLAEASGVPLTVLAVADRLDTIRELERAAAHLLADRAIQVRWRSLAPAQLDHLLRAIQLEEAALVVLSISSPRFPEATVSKLLDHITNPVLLIR